jgi:hypothetical protein
MTVSLLSSRGNATSRTVQPSVRSARIAQHIYWLIWPCSERWPSVVVVVVVIGLRTPRKITALPCGGSRGSVGFLLAPCCSPIGRCSRYNTRRPWLALIGLYSLQRGTRRAGYPACGSIEIDDNQSFGTHFDAVSGSLYYHLIHFVSDGFITSP